MNQAEIVSKLTNTLRLMNVGQRIPRRFVLKVVKDISKNLLSQKLLDRTISLESNLYTQVKCLEFTKVESVDCPMIEFRRCGILMKSKNKLPELVFSRLGSSIREVTNIDDTLQFTVTNPSQYRRDKDRKYKMNNQLVVYLGTDMHLYIPDDEVYSLNLDLLTMNVHEADAISNCKKCDKCKSAWDYPFICSDKLETVVYKEALNILASTYKAIMPDTNPNGNEKN